MGCRKDVCCILCIIKQMCAFILHYVMFTCTLLRGHPKSKKMLGETWATDIKAINSILWTNVASRYSLAGMGQGQAQYVARRRPWRTNSWGASREPMFKYVNWLVYIYCSVIAIFTLLLHTYLLMINNCRLLACTSLWLYNNRRLFFAG